MTDKPVITVTATIMDGTVVRWYRAFGDAQTRRPFLSASRNGVKVHEGYLHEIPDEVLQVAQEAYGKLRRTPGADLSELATHINKGPLNGPLVPVEEATDGL